MENPVFSLVGIDSNYILCGSTDEVIKVDIKKFEIEETCKVKGDVSDIIKSMDQGDTFLCGCRSGLFSVNTKSMTSKLLSFKYKWLFSVSPFSPPSTYSLHLFTESSLRLFDTTTLKTLSSSPGGFGRSKALKCDDDNSYIVIRAERNKIEIL